MRTAIATLILCLATLSVDAQQLPSFELPDALARVLRDYESAWRAKDPAALAALFTEDGFVLQNGRPPVRGRAAIHEAYAKSGGPLYLRALAYSADGVTGYIIGAYSGKENGPDEGKFILALRQYRDGRWMIAADMDNSNGRPPAAPSSGPLYLDGTIGAPAEGGITGETRQALEKIKANLTAQGSSLERVAKCTVYLVDMKDFDKMDAVYREYFPAKKPARTTVAVSALPAGAKVELDCVAAVP